MSNHYNSNQQWDQYFPQQQPPLGSDFQFEYPSQQPHSSRNSRRGHTPRPSSHHIRTNISALFGNQHSRTSSWSKLSPQISPTGRQGSQGQGVNPQQAYPSVGNYHQFTPPRFPQTGSLQGGLTTSPGGRRCLWIRTFSSIGEPMPPLQHTSGHALPQQGNPRILTPIMKTTILIMGDTATPRMTRKPNRSGHAFDANPSRSSAKSPTRANLAGDAPMEAMTARFLVVKSAGYHRNANISSIRFSNIPRNREFDAAIGISYLDEAGVSVPLASGGAIRCNDKEDDRRLDFKNTGEMQELSSFILSDASVPQSYVAEEDPEDAPESDDEYYQDAHDDPDAFGHGDDRVNWAVEDSDGQPSTHQGGRQIRHRTSASSMGTTKSATGGRKKNDDKPANLPVPAAPFGLFGRMSLQSQSEHGGNEEDGDEAGAGIANERFFRPCEHRFSFSLCALLTYFLQQLLQKHLATHKPPSLGRSSLDSCEGPHYSPEAEKLFQIYYSEMNLSVSLLDPVLYDAKRTFWRSPFLFTVICAIASRFYSERPDLYLQAMQHAQVAAGNALISGTKNVEMCAAYILMSLYPLPVKRWEQQRSWLYLGLAIRVATDLNLHLPITAKPKNENHAREMLNRTRIWLNCFNLDRSTGSQYGKPPIISNNDYTANHSENWWKSSQLNLSNFDIHICAYNAELRHMSKFIAQIYSDPHHPTGLNKVVDFEAIATQTDDELQKLQTHWLTTLASSGNSNPEARFRTGLLRLAYSYARLIALSYGFQHAFGKNDGLDENPFLQRCLNAASDVVRTVDTGGGMALMPRASLSLCFSIPHQTVAAQVRLVPSREKRVEIRNLVQKVIDLLASPEIAVDNRHGPKLYSKFLKNLLAKPLAQIDPPNTRGVSEPPALGHRRLQQLQACLWGGSLCSDEPIMSMFDGNMNNSNPDDTFMEYFQPELPFDPDIIRSFNDLSDPNSWQDISMPGFNLMTEVKTTSALLVISAR
ncbi:hypothetical protein BKA70DRAFT_1426129 [Coprinopsis sp. MPI-PUGE-AT-0042]|nr:hypothetical protein BKA70DRAFT_1426129 [Coprinopsis sp. MPI-PUGE-AT-0042]